MVHWWWHAITGVQRYKGTLNRKSVDMWTGMAYRMDYQLMEWLAYGMTLRKYLVSFINSMTDCFLSAKRVWTFAQWNEGRKERYCTWLLWPRLIIYPEKMLQSCHVPQDKGTIYFLGIKKDEAMYFTSQMATYYYRIPFYGEGKEASKKAGNFRDDNGTESNFLRKKVSLSTFSLNFGLWSLFLSEKELPLSLTYLSLNQRSYWAFSGSPIWDIGEGSVGLAYLDLWDQAPLHWIS